jgi:hypothetical protein
MNRRIYDENNCSNDCVICKDRCNLCGIFDTRDIWAQRISELLDLYEQTWTSDQETSELIREENMLPHEADIIFQENRNVRKDIIKSINDLNLSFSTDK